MNHFKKTSKKLEKLRGVFFQLGLLIACGLSLLAFEWTFPTSLSGLGGEIIYEEEWENPVDPFDIIEEEVEKEKIIEKPKVDPLKFEIVPNEKKVPKEEPIEIKKKEIKKETKKKVKKKKAAKKKVAEKKVAKKKAAAAPRVSTQSQSSASSVRASAIAFASKLLR